MEFLLTTRPDLKDGIKMPVDVKSQLRDEIIRLLDTEGGVSLPSFFEICLTGRAKKRVGIVSRKTRPPI